MATVARTDDRAKNVLRGIPYKVYVALRRPEHNHHVRMEYLDGVLTIMSPGYIHDFFAERVGFLILAVVQVFRIPFAAAGSTTLRQRGDHPRKGAGKEPDRCYYFANERRIRGNTEINLDIDPPPDLAIEIENSRKAAKAMKIYARLRVPEVWRYDARKGALRFDALQPDGTYAKIAQSLSLPILTPALVMELLDRCEGVDQTTWLCDLQVWLRDVLLPAHRPPAAGGDA